MKAGATERMLVQLSIEKEVDSVIFTLRSAKGDITKNFTGNPNNGIYIIDLDQSETKYLEGVIQIEGQINYSDLSVKKTNIGMRHISSTLATEIIEGNAPTDSSADVILEIIQGDVALVITPESSQELIDAVTELFLQTKAVADSVREDADSGKFDGEPGAKGEKGDKGDKGDQGEQGIQGEKGEKGDKGDKGDKGVAGADGKDGADGYTPIKGTDYFTPEEIAEIEEDVAESIGDDYVQKEAGKGLSSNDFTDSYKELLDFRITKHPNDIIGVVGISRTLSITAVGEGLTYQWQYSSGSGTNWTNVSNGTSDTLTFTIPDRSYHGRLYRCQVTNGSNDVLYSNTCQVLFNDSQRISNLETQLGGNSIVVIEESDYEALVTPDENTIYLITEDNV